MAKKKKTSALPTKSTPPLGDPAKASILAYGPSKVGKSTFAAGFPSPLFIAFPDAGLEALDVFRVDIRDTDEGSAWDLFLETCVDIAAGEHQFETIVIDTVTSLYKACQSHVCDERGLTHPSDAPMGKGYDYVNTEFRRVLSKLASLPYGLVMTAHDHTREVKSGTLKLDKTMPAFPAGCRTIVLPLVSIEIYCTTTTVAGEDESEKRIGIATPTRSLDAGDRFGLLPERFPLSYASLARAFGLDTKGGQKKKKKRGRR